jgi:hypothetical protein
MKQFFKDLFGSEGNSNIRTSQQPIYTYQIDPRDLRYEQNINISSTRRTIEKGPANAGPSYNIAGS